jgi:3-hydroxyacyl-CoA dehydrogenase
VTLGTIPGAGGTVRLPRLIAVAEAITLVTTGKPIDAQKALAIGLIDHIAESDLIMAAKTLARELGRQPKPKALLDRPARESENIDWHAAAIVVRKKARGASAPVEALDALRESTQLSGPDALALERQRFLRLAGSDEAAALRYAFFSEKSAGKSLASIEAEPADLSHVGVIGGGTMGAGIAIALLLSGTSVQLLERDNASADKARQRVSEMLDISVTRGALSRQSADGALGLLNVTREYGELAHCALVIEAVFEDMSVKREVFAKLDAVTVAEAVLATNTSYLDVDRLAAATADRSRVLGLHFFAPPHVMNLLEIIRGEKTGGRALATGAALAKRLKKTAVVSGVCHGFIGNRIMAAYRRECEFMLLEGALPALVDASMREFGFPMGIFEVQDLSGLDIAWAQRKAAAPTRDPETPYCCIADRLCERGRLGRKTKKGWYDYGSGSAQVDQEVTEIIEEERWRSGSAVGRFSSDDIIQSIIQVMQREGEAILSEGIAERAADIDVVMVSGYSFPRHRGGPMYMLANGRR